MENSTMNDDDNNMLQLMDEKNITEGKEGEVQKISRKGSFSIEGRTCNICKMVFANKKLMKRHLMCVHSDDRPYKCDICFKSYKRSDHLRNHLSSHNKTNEEKKHICLICEQSFATAKELKHHKIKHYKCPYENCSYTYSTISKMKYHLNKHKCNLVYTCPGCSQTFVIYKDYIEHKKMCFKKKYVCLECNKIYLHLNGYNKHINKIHLKINTVFKCKIKDCNKQFCSDFSLKEHVINFHKGIKRFFCSKCNISFGYRSSFRRHNVNMHS